MDYEKLDKFIAEDALAGTLLGGRLFFTRNNGNINLIDKMASVEERIEAVVKMSEAHNIGYYPILREAAMTEPDAEVRKAIRVASDKLEEEFGEDECINCDLEFTGPIVVKNSEEAFVSGDIFGANLNDFR